MAINYEPGQLCIVRETNGCATAGTLWIVEERHGNDKLWLRSMSKGIKTFLHVSHVRPATEMEIINATSY